MCPTPTIREPTDAVIRVTRACKALILRSGPARAGSTEDPDGHRVSRSAPR